MVSNIIDRALQAAKACRTLIPIALTPWPCPFPAACRMSAPPSSAPCRPWPLSTVPSIWVRAFRTSTAILPWWKPSAAPCAPATTSTRPCPAGRPCVRPLPARSRPAMATPTIPTPRSPSPPGPPRRCSPPSWPSPDLAMKSSCWTRATTATCPPSAWLAPSPCACRCNPAASHRTSSASPPPSRPAPGCSSSTRRTTPAARSGRPSRCSSCRRCWPPPTCCCSATRCTSTWSSTASRTRASPGTRSWPPAVWSSPASARPFTSPAGRWAPWPHRQL